MALLFLLTDLRTLSLLLLLRRVEPPRFFGVVHEEAERRVEAILLVASSVSNTAWKREITYRIVFECEDLSDLEGDEAEVEEERVRAREGGEERLTGVAGEAEERADDALDAYKA